MAFKEIDSPDIGSYIGFYKIQSVLCEEPFAVSGFNFVAF
jgi:hypothetical protein